MNPNVQQKVKFLGSKIYDFSFTVVDDEHLTAQDELKLDIAINSTLVSETKKGFILNLKVVLTGAKSNLNFIVNSRSTFETENEIDETYLKGSMATVNAPAIVFPFVRAFITTISVNAGYNPIILPAINFAKMAEDSKK